MTDIVLGFRLVAPYGNGETRTLYCKYPLQTPVISIPKVTDFQMI